jgi:hypothetical protein
MTTDVDEIGITLEEMARHARSPKELLKAVKERFPNASKKLITRAAIQRVIINAAVDIPTANKLHDLAITARGPGD